MTFCICNGIPRTELQIPCTQINPCKDAYLPEDPTEAQTIKVTLQTSFCHSSRGEACKGAAVLKEPEEKSLIAAMISLRI